MRQRRPPGAAKLLVIRIAVGLVLALDTLALCSCWGTLWFWLLVILWIPTALLWILCLLEPEVLVK